MRLLERLPLKIRHEMHCIYGADLKLDHIVDWLLIQELDRRKKEEFTVNYNLDTLHNHVGDANEYVQD